MRSKGMGYEERIIRATGQIGLDALRGHVSDVHVRHDRWCRLVKSNGACNCAPNITLDVGGVLYTVDKLGNVHKAGGTPGGVAP